MNRSAPAGISVARPAPPAVHVHIERLVLEGFTIAPHELPAFAAELGRALERQLAAPGFAPSAAATAARPASVALSSAALDAPAARQIAGALATALSAPRPPGLPARVPR